MPNGPADTSFLRAYAGRFLVFDGPDGSGKSTQFRRLMDYSRDAGLTVCEVREPGGTEVGERIRNILLDPIHTEMSLRCEMMLYMASRAQLVEQRIRPALARGELVLADRFVSSTFAYQGAAGGLPEHEIWAVAEAACGPRSSSPGEAESESAKTRMVCPGASCWPDLVLIFDVDEQTAKSRLISPAYPRAKSLAEQGTLFDDRMEQKGAEFHRKVRAGYLQQEKNDPEHYAVIDARHDPDRVTSSMLQTLADRAPRTVGRASSPP